MQQLGIGSQQQQYIARVQKIKCVHSFGLKLLVTYDHK